LRFHETGLAGVIEVVLEPHFDDRGWFARAWSRDEFMENELDLEWEQLNVAHNPITGTLRGIHFQRNPHAETKLVRCTSGRLFDFAVDLRPSSPTFRRWVGRSLSPEEGNTLLIPAGFGHGYLTLEPDTDLLYLTSVRFNENAATGVRFDDPALGIDLPAPVLLLSDRDRSWPLLAERDDL
jgi:dTDP-4-dehydrorhamnose 3,5-epimerase